MAAVVSISSCSTNNSKDTKEVAEEHNEAKFDKSGHEKDTQFLVNAAAINLEEISLGQLAQQKSSAEMNHLKKLGKMMEDAHKKSLAELTAMAQLKNISLPTSQTENGKMVYKKLNEKSGTDFGKEYSGLMVNGHKDAIALFEKASVDCSDPEIRAWATATLPTLRIHLDQSLICQTQCEKL